MVEFGDRSRGGLDGISTMRWPLMTSDVLK